MTDDVERRIGAIERQLDNGRYLRKETFDVVIEEIRGDFVRIEAELGTIRAVMTAEKQAREDDRKGIRNLVLGAMFAAGSSVVVSLLVAAVNKP